MVILLHLLFCRRHFQASSMMPYCVAALHRLPFLQQFPLSPIYAFTCLLLPGFLISPNILVRVSFSLFPMFSFFSGLTVLLLLFSVLLRLLGCWRFLEKTSSSKLGREYVLSRGGVLRIESRLTIGLCTIYISAVATKLLSAWDSSENESDKHLYNPILTCKFLYHVAKSRGQHHVLIKCKAEKKCICPMYNLLDHTGVRRCKVYDFSEFREIVQNLATPHPNFIEGSVTFRRAPVYERSAKY